MAALLVVEDDAPIRMLLARILARDGHAVTCARHGAEAIEAIRAADFDLMILDVMMPVASAVDVMAYMREHARWIPTVIVTAAHDRQLANLNSDDVLAIVSKPFDVAMLSQTIAGLL